VIEQSGKIWHLGGICTEIAHFGTVVLDGEGDATAGRPRLSSGPLTGIASGATVYFTCVIVLCRTTYSHAVYRAKARTEKHRSLTHTA
jgi:hypothetical protein